MMLLSVLLVVTATILTPPHVAQCRRLSDNNDLDNDIGVTNTFSGTHSAKRSWVEIVTPPKSVISKQVGSHVELECEASGSPPPTLQWLKGKMPLTQNERFFESNLITDGVADETFGRVHTRLVINYLLPIHNGRFTCLAEGQAQIATADIDLYVIKKDGYERNFTQLIAAKILGAYHVPRITLWMSSYIEVIGSNAVLPCQSVGNPKPSVMWVDAEGQIVEDDPDRRRTVLPDGELSIRSITWADMGGYKCIVRNSVGEDSIETFLYPMTPSSK